MFFPFLNNMTSHYISFVWLCSPQPAAAHHKLEFFLSLNRGEHGFFSLYSVKLAHLHSKFSYKLSVDRTGIMTSP